MLLWHSMSEHFSIEELIIDDSFANYCFQSNEADILFWEDYIKANPSQKETIEEAMRIVLGLHVMLRQEHDEQNEKQLVLKAVPPSANKPVIRKMIRYAAAIAAVVLMVLGIKGYLEQTHSQKILQRLQWKIVCWNFPRQKARKKLFSFLTIQSFTSVRVPRSGWKKVLVKITGPFI